MAYPDSNRFQEPTKLWNKWYITILLLSMVNHVASQLITPVVSKYAMSVGATMATAGTIAGLMSLAAMFARPFAGLSSDRINKKLIIAVAGTVMGVCMYFYSASKSVEMMAAVRFVHGIFFSFSTVALLAFNTMFIPKDKIGEGIGWSVVTTTLATAVGPNLGLWLVDHYGYKACFVAAAIGTIIPNLCFLAVPNRQEPHVPGKSAKFNMNDFISLQIFPFALLTGLFSCCNGIVNSFLTLLGDERGIEGVGVFFTAYSVILIVTRPITGKLYDQKGIKFIMYPSIALAALSMLLLGKATSTWAVLLAGVFKALGQGTGAPSIQAHCLKKLGRDKAGVVSSTCYMGNDIGNTVGPTIGGLIASRAGYGSMFITIAVSVIVIGWPLLFFKTRYDEHKCVQ
jgi:predicted MFS family arabinose efflux permease